MWTVIATLNKLCVLTFLPSSLSLSFSLASAFSSNWQIKNNILMYHKHTYTGLIKRINAKLTLLYVSFTLPASNVADLLSSLTIVANSSKDVLISTVKPFS